MKSYRITFQTASDTLLAMVKAIIVHFDRAISKKEAIKNIINSVLNENYWEGSDIIKNVNFARFFKTQLSLSDEWVNKYIENLV